MSVGRIIFALAALVIFVPIAIPLFLNFRETDRAWARAAAGLSCLALAASVLVMALWAGGRVVPGAIDYHGSLYCREGFCEETAIPAQCERLTGVTALRPTVRVSWVSISGFGHVGGFPPGGMPVYRDSAHYPGSNDPTTLYLEPRPNCYVVFVGPLG